MRGLILGFAMLSFPPVADAGVHPSEIEKRLSFLVNDWTIKGRETTYSENCEWYADRSFVVCSTVYSGKSTPTRSVGIIGWSATTQNYTYYHYGQNGGSRLEACFANELSGLTCMDDHREKADLIQNRTHIWPVPGGIAFRHEQSRNGGPWKQTVEHSYVPRKR